VGTQTEVLHKQAAVQVSVCSEYLNLALEAEGVRDTACVRCDQIKDLLRQVVELREEVERLRRIRECESEIDWWSHTLRQRQQEEALQEVEEPLPSCHQAEGGVIRDKGEWREAPPQRGRRKPSQPPSPSHLTLYNRYGPLELEGQPNEEGREDPSGESPTACHSPPPLMTSSIKKKRTVIVVGDSILRGTEGPICRPHPSHREVCCLAGAPVRGIKRKVIVLVQPSVYYPLLVIQAGNDKVVQRSLKELKKDFKALGLLVRGSGAQVVFSSIPEVKGKNTERGWKTHLINTWLRDWCHRWNFGFFNYGEVYMAPGLLAKDGAHLSPRGKRILAQELVGLIDRALN
ncbi:hypothetical protein N331_07827, partial [Merops nubicus]